MYSVLWNGRESGELIVMKLITGAEYVITKKQNDNHSR